MKKALILILALITVLTFVTGCATKDAAPASAVTGLLDKLKESNADELKTLLLGGYSADSEEFAMFNSFDLTLFYKNMSYQIISSEIDNYDAEEDRTGTVKVKVKNTDFSLLMSDWADETIMAIAAMPEDTSLEDFNEFLLKKSGEILSNLLSSNKYKSASKTFEVKVRETKDGEWKIESGLDPNTVLIGLDDFSNALKMS